MITYYPNCSACCGGVNYARLWYYESVEKSSASTPAALGNIYAQYRTYLFADGTTRRLNQTYAFNFNNNWQTGEGPHKCVATARDNNNNISEIKLVLLSRAAFSLDGINYNLSAANNFETVTDYTGNNSYYGIVLCTLSGGIETLYYTDASAPITAVILEPV